VYATVGPLDSDDGTPSIDPDVEKRFKEAHILIAHIEENLSASFWKDKLRHGSEAPEC